ncbi:MAG: hypothetical protein R2939_04955 [Kofleriaceae bacterium]
MPRRQAQPQRGAVLGDTRDATEALEARGELSSLRMAVPMDKRASDGPADALVTIVAALDPGAAFGLAYLDRLAELRQRYGDEVRIVWHHLLSRPGHHQVGALALCAARAQGKLEPLLRLALSYNFDLDEDGLAAPLRPPGAQRLDQLRELAAETGLDVVKWERALRGKACKDEVKRDAQALVALGAIDTPYTWINGRPLRGARPIEAFVAIVDEELAQARAAVGDSKPAVAATATQVLRGARKTLPTP